ncbi:MAG: general secretion pathway protein GspB [Wenzhouxiangellaceae bacterium]|nr:general secretion pathway protein GspB [Wenzhouxiangellaceae bacterium]
MSLLLDALRKSDAQRRRGQTPTLELSALSNARPEPVGKTRRFGLLALVLLLVAVVVVVASRLGPSQPLATSESSSNTATVADRSPRSGDDDVGSQAVGVAQNVEASLPEAGRPERADAGPIETRLIDAESLESTSIESTPGPDRQMQQPGSGSEPALQGPGTGAEVARQQLEPQGADLQAQQEQVPEPRVAEPADVDSDTEVGLDAAEKRKLEALAAARLEQSDSFDDGDDEGTREGASETPPARENFIRPWELPQSQRAGFPKLDLSVHVYAANPRGRFVLINGERYTEGDQVGEGVVLAEIVRAGAIIDFGNYRVLIE